MLDPKSLLLTDAEIVRVVHTTVQGQGFTPQLVRAQAVKVLASLEAHTRQKASLAGIHDQKVWYYVPLDLIADDLRAAREALEG